MVEAIGKLMALLLMAGKRRYIAAQVAANIVDSNDTDSDATIVWVKNSGELTTTTDPGAVNTESKGIWPRESVWHL